MEASKREACHEPLFFKQCSGGYQFQHAAVPDLAECLLNPLAACLPSLGCRTEQELSRPSHDGSIWVAPGPVIWVAPSPVIQTLFDSRDSHWLPYVWGWESPEP